MQAFRSPHAEFLAGLLLSVGLGALAPAGGAEPDAGEKAAHASITAAGLLEHIKVLASDEFEGRAPGSAGEDRTVDYLTEQYRSLGLKPGNPDGSYVQAVPLVGFQATAAAGEFRVGGAKGRTIDLSFLKDWVGVSRRRVPEVTVDDSEVVFVGYGVVAPEYGWDDYKGFDVRGKTIVMLVGDPAIPDLDKPGQLDPNMFKGRAMTYYGRWTYKYEIASEKGAAAALLVHETAPAGYPFSVVTGSWGRENFEVQQGGEDQQRVKVEGWVSTDKAKELFTACGRSFEDMKEAALRRDFRPVPLEARARFAITNRLRPVESRNVVARLVGSDPKLRDEWVIYTAHWDHLGRDPSLQGDQIFNGAADNASGVAALLELARAFTRLPTPPRRSILFLAVTAEEKGLLGAKYYAAHPLYPLQKTLADINMDVLNLWGRTHDVISVGKGQSTLDDLLEAAAADQGREVAGDAEPEKGFFFRSDHFEFAKRGVPALDPKGGMHYLGKPGDFGQHIHDEYTQHDYHKVSDEIKPGWDLSGAVEDLQLLFTVGLRLANSSVFPQWKPGSEFKARREAMFRTTAP